MKRQLRTVWLMLVVMLTLAGVLYWDDWANQRERNSKSENLRVFSFAVDDVVELRYVDQATATRVELVRKEDGWQLTEPLHAKADATTIDNILRTIGDFRAQMLVSDDPERWEEYGVDDENQIRRIEWEMETGDRYALILGFETVVDYSVYFRSGDSNQVYAGSQYILTGTEHVLHDFRDRSVVALQPDLVERLSYRVGDSLLAEFGRTADRRRFYFTFPIGIEADHASVVGFLEAIRQTEAADFIDRPDKNKRQKFSNDPNRLIISWHAEAEDPEGNGHLTVAEVEEGVFWARNHNQDYFQLNHESVRALTKHLVDFRNRRIIDFDAAEVQFVRIDSQTYRRDGDMFYAQMDSSSKSEPAKHIDNLLMDLHFSRAKSFLDRGEPKYSKLFEQPPNQTIEIGFVEEAGRPNIILRVWRDPDDDDQLVLDVHGQPNLFLIRSQDLSNASAKLQNDL